MFGCPGSASYAPAQFRMEFSSNRSDDVCGIILGEATDKKHLISQCQAGRDVLCKHGTGSPRASDEISWSSAALTMEDFAGAHSEEYVQSHGVDQRLR
jgi:hypothetical protein